MNGQATILAVDDTSESLSLLVKILTAAGFRVRPADSGELALSAVAAALPDLILLDMRMKGMDGLEVCRQLKAKEATRHIPIILISAFADVREWVAGLQLGAADYINKPFQTEELLARVKAQLALSQAMVALERQATELRLANERLQSEIAERQKMQEQLKALSIHDAMTGLYNRGFFEEEMARFGRGRQFPISILMADLNGLKKANDGDGHAAGDVLIQRTAQVLTAAFRTDDIVARIGGDEFAVLLPDTDAASAQQSILRLRRELNQHNAAHGGRPLSIAFGVSTAERGGALTDALKEADERMYEEKHGASVIDCRDLRGSGHTTEARSSGVQEVLHG